MISGSVKTFERLSTAPEPMAKLKSLVRAETPILLSPGFILLVPSSMSYAGAGYRRRAAKPERVPKLPCGCLLPSQCRCGEDQVTVDQIGRLAIDDPPRSHRCPSPAGGDF